MKDYIDQKKKKSGLECKLCVGVCLDDTVAIV